MIEQIAKDYDCKSKAICEIQNTKWQNTGNISILIPISIKFQIRNAKIYLTVKRKSYSNNQLKIKLGETAKLV